METTTAARTSAHDRSLDQPAADLALKGEIEKALLSSAPDLAAMVYVDGRRGGPIRAVACRPHRPPGAGDREVYDDIEVVTGGTLVDSAEDAAINKTLGLNLLAAQGWPRGASCTALECRAGALSDKTSNGVNDTAFIMGPDPRGKSDRDRTHCGAPDAGSAVGITHVVLDR